MQLGERIRYSRNEKYKNCNKNLMDKFNSRFNPPEEKTGKLENKPEGNTQNVDRQRKNVKVELRGIGNRLRRFNIQLSSHQNSRKRGGTDLG